MKKRNDNPFDDEFKISFAGLNQGKHFFDFTINQRFFEHFNTDEITSGKFEVNIQLVKQSTMLALDFDVNGLINSPCDRCGELIDVPVHAKNELIVKLNSSAATENDDVIALPIGETQIDVSQFIYEYIILGLPARKVHPDDDDGNHSCNPEVLKKLEELKAKPAEEETDPRWEKLKALKFKN